MRRLRSEQALRIRCKERKMFIDIHIHVVANPAPTRNGKINFSSPEYMIKRYNMVGIERAVILPLASPEGSVQIQSSEETMAVVQKHPDRYVAFCNVDPRMDTNDERANLDYLVGYYKGQGFLGCGEVCANLPFDDPRVENLFRACENHAMPLCFHIGPQIGGCYGLVDAPGLPKLERALQEFPRLIFLGHSQPFWAEIGPLAAPADRGGYPKGAIVEPGRVVELMRRYPNLHGDLSAGSGYNAVSRDEAFGVQFMNEFQDRLYFGTDICHPDTPMPLVDYLIRLRREEKLSEGVFRKIAKGNAMRLLGLQE